MSWSLLFASKITGAIAACLVAGVFFAFSNFVMAGLARIPPDQGLAAMRSINVTVINPLFMSLLFGTALLGLFAAGLSLRNLGGMSEQLTLLGALVYLIGCVGVTMAFNVPLNEAMAGGSEATFSWSQYLSDWTMWNHIRTIASLAAAVLFGGSVLADVAR